jgi:serine/threonine protein kinase
VVEGLNYIHMFSVPFSLDDPRTVSDGDNIRLVHGDLKPVGILSWFDTVNESDFFFQTNVLVDEYRVAKLCDFGLIRLTRPNGTINMSTKSGHTGTPLYLSYELAEGDSSPTQASDIHALGCVGLEVSIFFSSIYADINSFR